MSKQGLRRAIWAVCAAGFLFLVEYSSEYLYFGRVNQSPLVLETIDGTGQAYHPSVLYFDEPWQGFKYWMAQSPYPIDVPPYRGRWECPSIHVSHDGKHWKTFENNPIDELLPSEIENQDFFSDPHLVYRDGRLECFYRYSSRTDDGYHTVLNRKICTDGHHWGEREVLLDFFDPDCRSTVGDMVRSPAVLWQDGRYKMWFVDNADPKGIKQVCYSESPDGSHWSERAVCQLEGLSVEPWHLDVNYLEGKYILTVYDFHDLTIWESEDGQTFRYETTALSPSEVYGSFYSYGLYRSSLIKDAEGYKMYFSADDDKRTDIGLMAGPDPEHMTVISVDGPYRSYRGFFKPFFKIWKTRLWRLKQRVV